MTSIDICFISKNGFKLKEAVDILAPFNVIPLKISLDQLQTQDMELLVKDKTMGALGRVGRPLSVERTGLHPNHLNGLPGVLTQTFWDTLEAERFGRLFGTVDHPRVIARTVIGYTDGKQFFSFRGEIAGTIASTPRPSGFSIELRIYFGRTESDVCRNRGTKERNIDAAACTRLSSIEQMFDSVAFPEVSL
jgi:XTP/dITP diphosphohydrolase